MRSLPDALHVAQSTPLPFSARLFSLQTFHTVSSCLFLSKSLGVCAAFAQHYVVRLAHVVVDGSLCPSLSSTSQPGAILLPQGAVLETFLVVTIWGWLLPASSGWRPWMLLNILPFTEHASPPAPRKDLSSPKC